MLNKVFKKLWMWNVIGCFLSEGVPLPKCHKNSSITILRNKPRQEHNLLSRGNKLSTLQNNITVLRKQANWHFLTWILLAASAIRFSSPLIFCMAESLFFLSCAVSCFICSTWPPTPRTFVNVFILHRNSSLYITIQLTK